MDCSCSNPGALCSRRQLWKEERKTKDRESFPAPLREGKLWFCPRCVMRTCLKHPRTRTAGIARRSRECTAVRTEINSGREPCLCDARTGVDGGGLLSFPIPVGGVTAISSPGVPRLAIAMPHWLPLTALVSRRSIGAPELLRQEPPVAVLHHERGDEACEAPTRHQQAQPIVERARAAVRGVTVRDRGRWGRLAWNRVCMTRHSLDGGVSLARLSSQSL